MERHGLKPCTIHGRVAAARSLYTALRWARATMIDHVHVPHDPTPPWDKRLPYDNDELAAMLPATADRRFDHALILLGAHAGLRASECVNLAGRDLTSSPSVSGRASPPRACTRCAAPQAHA